MCYLFQKSLLVALIGPVCIFHVTLAFPQKLSEKIQQDEDALQNISNEAGKAGNNESSTSSREPEVSNQNEVGKSDENQKVESEDDKEAQQTPSRTETESEEGTTVKSTYEHHESLEDDEVNSSEENDSERKKRQVQAVPSIFIVSCHTRPEICNGAESSWTFNASRGLCEQKQACRSTPNRFTSKQSCEKECHWFLKRSR